MPIEFGRDGPWELPDGWVWARLGDLGDWSSGGTPKADVPSFYGGDIPWFRITELNEGRLTQPVKTLTKSGLENSSAKIIKAPFLMFAMYGASIGKMAISQISASTNQAIASCRPHDGIDIDYLFWALKSSKRRLILQSQGGAQPNISQRILLNHLVPVAPHGEQLRIVSRIHELFTEITDGETALAHARGDLDTWRRALLKAAVTGELTREWRKENTPNETGEELFKRVRNARAKLLRARRSAKSRSSHRIEEASLLDFDIPDTWCWVTWGDIGVSQNGRSFPSSDYSTEGIKLLRPGNLYASGRIGWTTENTRHLPVRYLQKNRDLLVGGQELIMNLTAQSLKDDFLGRTCITSDGEQCLLNQRLARLTPFEVLPEFMLIVFKSTLFRSFVRHLNSGSLIQHMFTSQIDSFRFPLPPMCEQIAVVDRVNVGLGMVEDLSALALSNTRNPGDLRQSVLKAAFEGRLVEHNLSDEPATDFVARLGQRSESILEARKTRLARRDVVAIE